ncbi:multicopper oxidase [Bacteroidota bacterium]|nr:multicopper oxidase [Bacteroidota bacterium]
MIQLFKKCFLVTAAIAAVTFFADAQNPLAIPPALTGTNFNLNVQSGTTQFFSGINTPTYGVNGVLLAPTLIINIGDVVTMNVTNNLPGTTTTMHWHGMHVPAMDDGGPHQIIQQGATWSPSFKVMNDAGTYWYHPHGENKTDIQVSKGIAGMIIVKDSLENTLTLPRTYGVDDFPIIVQSKAFDVLYQVAIATYLDTLMMVNGTVNPYLDAPAQVVRLRLLNGSSNRTFLFGFSNNMNFNVIGNDDGLLEQPVQLNRLRVSNGERYEILVDLASLQGQSIQLMNYGSQIPNGIVGAPQVGNGMATLPNYNLNPLNGADFSVLQINVTAPTANPVTTIPTTLRTFTPWLQSQANVTRTLTFAPETMGPQFMIEGPFTINGDNFNMDTINITSYLNDIEIWTLQNNTLVAHPFHIHDGYFYVLNINGGAVPPEQQGKKDVVLVMPQQTVSFITKFEDFADDSIPYMYHCHLLHHEDDGMMGSFRVIDTTNTSVTDINKNDDWKIYPNPSSTILTVEIPASLQSLYAYEIYDVNGKWMKSVWRNSFKQQIDISDLADGIYFLQPWACYFKPEPQKFIVNKNKN